MANRTREIYFRIAKKITYHSRPRFQIFNVHGRKPFSCFSVSQVPLFSSHTFSWVLLSPSCQSLLFLLFIYFIFNGAILPETIYKSYTELTQRNSWCFRLWNQDTGNAILKSTQKCSSISKWNWDFILKQLLIGFTWNEKL